MKQKVLEILMSDKEMVDKATAIIELYNPIVNAATLVATANIYTLSGSIIELHKQLTDYYNQNLTLDPYEIIN